MDNPTEDLEKIRDERCFPIVRALVKEFPTGLMVEPEKQKELQLKSLSLMLSADLNVGQEVSYVSQIILGVLAGLNKTIQECDVENDEEHYIEVANKVLEIVANKIDTIKLGSVTPEETTADFLEIKKELNELFLTYSLSKLEVKYVMEKVFEHFTTLNNDISSSIANSTQRMEAKILGIEVMNDLSLKKLNEVLLQK